MERAVCEGAGLKESERRKLRGRRRGRCEARSAVVEKDGMAESAVGGGGSFEYWKIRWDRVVLVAAEGMKEKGRVPRLCDPRKDEFRDGSAETYAHVLSVLLLNVFVSTAHTIHEIPCNPCVRERGSSSFRRCIYSPNAALTVNGTVRREKVVGGREQLFLDMFQCTAQIEQKSSMTFKSFQG